MDGRILGIVLIGLSAPAFFWTAPTLAQEAPYFQPNTTTNSMMKLDRCPYYPSQAVCRVWEWAYPQSSTTAADKP
jgi:hypothetical protein